ncbi:MAG: arginine--tRNA ligase [Phycisphaerales bacterium]|nr:arginine--tRNA ligase [Phycisphaerales bacterium]
MPDPSDIAAYDPVRALAERFAAAVRAAFPQVDAGFDPLITATKNPALGDFQSNAAMPLGKRFGMSPRDAATKIIGQLDLAGLAEPVTASSIAGPGFINIRLRGDTLAALLTAIDTPGLGIAPPAAPRTVVVDLCGVNIAKEMHVGHLRATVIGDALARTLERLGHRVIRQNHVGDWGLPIAMVTAKLDAETRAGRIDTGTLDLPTLTRLYRSAQAECARDLRGLEAVRRFGLGPKAEAELGEQVAGAEAAMARAKDTLLRLQAGDPATVAVWRRIYDVTMTACLAVCARLHARVRAEDSAGESSYAAELEPMVADLVRRGIAEESDGALVIRLDELGIDVPCLIRKADGGYLYATTDMAAVRRRVQNLGAARVIYAVGSTQLLHLRQVFAASAKAGYATPPGAAAPASLEHAAFGSVLGDDGRPFKTRSGDNVRLEDLLDEAVERAGRVVAEKNPGHSPQERREIAEAVGIAAIKYTDLSTDRIKDYVFRFDRMLAFEGNTGPYLLYALVRTRSIFRKGGERGIGGGWRSAPLRIEHPAEKALALALLRYPGVVKSVGDSLEPHRLCQYAYDLAGAFSTFFDACPVLQAPDDATRDARLRLCDLTARVLADALGVLGLPTLERM